MSDIRVDAPFGLEEGVGTWHGKYKSVDDTVPHTFSEADVAEVLYEGDSGDLYDGTEVAIIRLTSGELVAWQTWYGPTGTGFSEDAYGGDVNVWFAAAENLRRLVLTALDDNGRRLVGIPAEGLPS